MLKYPTLKKEGNRLSDSTEEWWCIWIVNKETVTSQETHKILAYPLLGDHQVAQRCQVVKVMKMKVRMEKTLMNKNSKTLEEFHFNETKMSKYESINLTCLKVITWFNPSNLKRILKQEITLWHYTKSKNPIWITTLQCIRQSSMQVKSWKTVQRLNGKSSRINNYRR